MLSRQFRNRIACTPDAYWKCALTEDYNRRLYVDCLNYRQYKLLREEDRGDRVYRRIQYAAPPPPGPLRSIGAMFRAAMLTEALDFDRMAARASITYHPSSHGELVNVSAEIWCEPSDSGSIEHVFDCAISLKIPGIGGLAERTLAAFFEKQCNALAVFTEDYLRQAGLG